MEEEDNKKTNLPSAGGIHKFLAAIAKGRKEQKISQKEMGEKLGISQTAYRKIETGETDLKVVTMFQIMEILGMRFNNDNEESFVATSDLRNLATKDDLQQFKNDILNDIKQMLQSGDEKKEE